MVSIVEGTRSKILRTVSAPIGTITEEMKTFAARMEKVLADTEHGIGLAAPQIGVNLRLFVILPERIWTESDTWDPKALGRVFINPELKDLSRETRAENEGCLSLPELWVEFSRPRKVTITATDLQGKRFKLRAKGFLARVFQHEVDHLNGILIADYRM
ncbi:MAG: peptide deformylase [bacterium]|nr:peptide deformylase [bacterium]MDZ4296337.1 peptide deformylase [Patescibacteria group bacterium]